MPAVTVKNRTRDRLIGDSVEIASSFCQRGRGLMFVSGLDEGAGLIIDPCSSIHTFWMRFPLDVLYMDRESRVVRADSKMKPWRIGPIFTGAKWVIELPPGTISATGTQAGDIIELER
ncbi:MAG: DUF192 domain-containing protein [Sphaerobacteraceae bacterium]|nr:MAG: DUF192 domain-containing protein [Sphaerobacteraceae bacterium]